MTAEEAKEILREGGQYVYMTSHEDNAVLDGVFNRKELEAVIFLLNAGEPFRIWDWK